MDRSPSYLLGVRHCITILYYLYINQDIRNTGQVAVTFYKKCRLVTPKQPQSCSEMLTLPWGSVLVIAESVELRRGRGAGLGLLWEPLDDTV